MIKVTGDHLYGNNISYVYYGSYQHIFHHETPGSWIVEVYNGEIRDFLREKDSNIFRKKFGLTAPTNESK